MSSKQLMMSYPVASGPPWQVLLSAVNQRLCQAPPPAPLLDQSGKGGRPQTGSALWLLSPLPLLFSMYRLEEVLPAPPSLPIPVPSQQQNFQTLDQNLHSSRPDAWPRSVSMETGHTCCCSCLTLNAVLSDCPVRRRASLAPPSGRPAAWEEPRWEGPTAGRQWEEPMAGRRWEEPEACSPPASVGAGPGPGLGQPAGNSSSLCFPTAPEGLVVQPGGLAARLHSAPCLLEYTAAAARQKIRKQQSEPGARPWAGATPTCPLHCSPRLSELLQRSPLPTILGSPSRVGAFSLPLILSACCPSVADCLLLTACC